MDKRSTLEAFANALQVAPSELTGSPLLMEGVSVEHAVLAPMRVALADHELGEAPEQEPPPWPELNRRLREFNAMRPKADYAALGAEVPGLLADLHASREGAHAQAALLGLVDVYSASQAVAKNLGAGDLATIASGHVRAAAEALGGPEWTGLSAWARAQAIGSTARGRARAVAMSTANDISGHLSDPRVADVYAELT